MSKEISENQLPQSVSEELGLVIEALHERHIQNSRIWYPHEFIPWSKGRDFAANEGWNPDEYPIEDGARSALFVNLLTEDNLPYYTETLLQMFGPEHPFRDWIGRWTAEENRHSTVIRSWIDITRALDSRELEDARMAQMTNGKVPQPPNAYEAIAYVSFQELATQIAHRNTAKHLIDNAGKKIMARVAGDETLHHIFYRDLASSMIEIEPEKMVLAIAKQLRGFSMPGTGIRDFDVHQRKISELGIYDLRQFKSGVVEPTLEAWNFWDIPSSSEIDAAKRSVERRLKTLGKMALLQ